MLKELKQHIREVKQKKYDLILIFLNKIFDTKYTSLLMFENMDINKIDKLKFFDLLNDNKDILEMELNIEIDEYTMKADEIIALCMRSINYCMIRKYITVKKNGNETKRLLISIQNGK
jgi:hypothetical protein